MKIIINADDFGMTKSVNKAIFEIAKKGALSSTTVMVNMPYASEAKELLDLNISIGLHFNLTEGKSISDMNKVKSLVDEKGYFLGKPDFMKRINSKQVKQEEVLIELEAQYNKLYEIIGDRLDHFDSHQGLNKLSVVNKALLQFGKKNKIAAVRVYTKYYLKKNNNGKYTAKFPSLHRFLEFGIKRVLVEFVLNYKVSRLKKYYSHTHGLLLASSHNAIDVFKSLSELDDAKNLPNVLVEIPFHPSIDTVELTNTKLKQERVDEYNYMTSEPFLKAISTLNIVDYSHAFK